MESAGLLGADKVREAVSALSGHHLPEAPGTGSGASCAVDVSGFAALRKAENQPAIMRDNIPLSSKWTVKPMASQDVQQARDSVLASIADLRERVSATIPPASGLGETDFSRIQAAVDDAKSPNTRRAYRGAWARFEQWADGRGVKAADCGPAHVAAFLGELSASGRSLATIRLHQSAISAGFKLQGVSRADNPALDGRVSEVVKGFAARASAPKQATGLDAAALGAIRETAMIPRRGKGGVMESPEQAKRRGQVDIALASVMSSTGLRRSEAAALTWGDVQDLPGGAGLLTVRASKTRKASEGGDIVAVPRSAMLALAAIRPAGGDGGASVFGLSASQIHRRLRGAGQAAGIDGLGGHSPRVGLAVNLERVAAPASVIQRQGRWSSPKLIARYTRGVQAAEALRWLE